VSLMEKWELRLFRLKNRRSRQAQSTRPAKKAPP